MKNVKLSKKKIVAGCMALFMVLGFSGINVNAAAVTTNTIETGSAHYYYVRQSGSTALLGIMKLYVESDGVYNEFTAEKKCDSVTVYVSNTKGSYRSQSVSNLRKGYSVVVKKSVSNPSNAYGYCTVVYQ